MTVVHCMLLSGQGPVSVTDYELTIKVQKKTNVLYSLKEVLLGGKGYMALHYGGRLKLFHLGSITVLQINSLQMYIKILII